MKHLVDPGSSIHEDDFSRPIHGLTSWMDDFLQIPIDHIHVQIEPSTPLRTLHIMAITMRHYCLFVTQKGCLVGTVTREDIQQKIVRSPFFEIILWQSCWLFEKKDNVLLFKYKGYFIERVLENSWIICRNDFWKSSLAGERWVSAKCSRSTLRDSIVWYGAGGERRLILRMILINGSTSTWERE